MCSASSFLVSLNGASNSQVRNHRDGVERGDAHGLTYHLFYHFCCSLLTRRAVLCERIPFRRVQYNTP